MDKLAHCVQLQAVGESPRNLYCADPSHLGLPLFLSNSEILSVYSSGFMVLSAKGDKLWGQESAQSPSCRKSQAVLEWQSIWDIGKRPRCLRQR